MAILEWDKVGDRRYETGVDHGVLYVQDPSTGGYQEGVVWNGLTAVNQTPTGGEANPQYADNIKYLNLMSNEEFEATIEAFTYPAEFMVCDGTASPATGVYVGQQSRVGFGFSWRTLIGNDTQGTDYGDKIHMVWAAMAAPSEKSNSTVNDSPEASTFSWGVTTTPTAVGTVGTGPTAKEYRPAAHIAIDSTEVDADDLATLEALLYGGESAEATLPTPAEVIAIFTAA